MNELLYVLQRSFCEIGDNPIGTKAPFVILLCDTSYIELLWGDVMQKNIRDYNLICTYGALFLGVLIGCMVLLVSLVFECDILFDKGLEEYSVGAAMNIPMNQMILYILKKRIIQVVIYLLMLLILPYDISSFLFCSTFGFYYGLVISNLIVKFSITGLVYGWACFFPHYLIYFYVIYLIGKWKRSSLKVYYQNMKFVELVVKIFVISFLLIRSRSALLLSTNRQRDGSGKSYLNLLSER